MNQGTLFAMPFDLSSLQPTGSPAPVVEGVGHSAEGGAYYDVSTNGVLVFSPGSVGGGTSLQAASVALPAITEGWTGDRKSAALELSRRLGLRRTPQADRAPSRVVAQR